MTTVALLFGPSCATATGHDGAGNARRAVTEVRSGKGSTTFHAEDEAPFDVEKLNRFDSDGDGLVDGADNCPGTPNADQDGDGIGDVCEPKPMRLDTATTLSASPSPARAGRPLSLTRTIRNTGTATVPAVTANTSLPEQFPFSSLSASQGTCTRNDLDNIHCELGDIPVGASVSIVITGMPRSATELRLNAFAMSKILDHDANSSNDQPSASVPVVPCEPTP